MKYRELGNTGEEVSVICLGTMTWGEQNTEEEAHDQMDYALDQGINFFDTAEMYAIPPSPETQGLTEKYIGNWFKKNGNRDKVFLASKVATRRNGIEYLRGGEMPRFDKKNIKIAVEKSLERLQTDRIDLYQLHWPDRETNFFGVRGYKHNPDDDAIELEETFEVLKELVDEGKIRYVGLSNETPWGVMECVRLAEQKSLPKVVSIQNAYNLLLREFEFGLAEMAIRENVGLLAYSPLATGVLSGKYLDGKKPEGARHTLFSRTSGRYNHEYAQPAIEKYYGLAKEYDLDPSQMALAFVNMQPFVTSNIIGATKMDQLKANIASIDLDLPEEVVQKIEEIHSMHPNPCT